MVEQLSIGKRIERRRLRKGLSSTDLARAAGVSKSLISQLESGKRDGKRTAVGVMENIARALGVSLDYLVGMYDEDGLEPAAVDLISV